MKKILYSFSFLLITFLIGACTLQDPPQEQTTLSTGEQMFFSRFVALGDNIITGYQSGALTRIHQDYSFAAQIARQAGTSDFQQPLLAYPGLGSESYAGYGILELLVLDNPQTPFTRIPDPVIFPAAFADYPDFSIQMPFFTEDIKNYPLPYSNLGVPGIFVEDVLTAKTQLLSKSHSGLLNVILRNPLPEPYGMRSPFEQAKLFQPSVIACWAGMYDVLGYAQVGIPGQSISKPTTVENFTKHYSALIDSLLNVSEFVKAAGSVIVANIPDITDMPYFNIVAHVVIDSATNTPYINPSTDQMVNLIGVGPNDLILMPAKQALRQGYGKPTGVQNGNGEPIPEPMVLDSTEIALIRESIEGYNNAIESICAQKQVPVVDMHSFFKSLKSGLNIGGNILNDTYIIGGFYSLDGIHPTDVGNALIANEWLRNINKTFRISIPPVDVVKVMQDTQPARL